MAVLQPISLESRWIRHANTSLACLSRSKPRVAIFEAMTQNGLEIVWAGAIPRSGADRKANPLFCPAYLRDRFSEKAAAHG